MDLGRHFATCAHNNAWSNHRLIGACAQLTDAEFAAPRTSFFPSIKATLNHNLTVDWMYLEVLERSRDGLPATKDTWRFFEPEEPFATCAPLWAAQKAADARLIAYCKALTPQSLDGPVHIMRRAGPVTDRVSRILAHLFQHQVHHRGQAHAMLSATPVKPPQLDEFFCTNEADLRERDFAELGFTEEGIWGARVHPPGA